MGASNVLLTERELEILRLVAVGMSNKEIAEELVLAVNTVKWYISEIMSKLHVANRTQAVAHARTLGWLS
jgi:ATP/maltotriose-dependent transcriptional regulator MalT